MKNVLVTVEYDGSGFHGWQIQPRLRTVQGVLEGALSRVCGGQIRVQGTSRTDAGVHAYGQRASFAGDFGIPVSRIPVAVNNQMDDVRIVSAEEKPAGFHARHDAVGKTYLYRVRTGCADIFLRNYRYQLNESLNTHKMEEAAAHFVGTHDFAAFRAAGGSEPETTVRTIYGITVNTVTARVARVAETRMAELNVNPGHSEIARADAARACVVAEPPLAEEIELRVTGDGFLYNMVRIITGTLVEVGMGRRSPDDIPGIIASQDRTRAGHTAPPGGLWLERVYYSLAEIGENFAK